MVFCFSHKKVLKYPILFCFLTSTKIWPKKGAQKRITFFFLQKRGSQKKNVMLQPPFFSTIFLKAKTLMLNKKHKSKSGKNKDKEKGFKWESKTGNQKKEEGLMNKTLKFNSFMLLFSWSKSKEERQRKKETKKECFRGAKYRPGPLLTLPSARGPWLFVFYFIST